MFSRFVPQSGVFTVYCSERRDQPSGNQPPLFRRSLGSWSIARLSGGDRRSGGYSCCWNSHDTKFCVKGSPCAACDEERARGGVTTRCMDLPLTESCGCEEGAGTVLSRQQHTSQDNQGDTAVPPAPGHHIHSASSAGLHLGVEPTSQPMLRAWLQLSSEA